MTEPGRLRRTRVAVAVMTVMTVMAVLLAGCAGEASVTPPDLKSRIDVDNAGLRAAKREIGVRPCPPPQGSGSDLPDLTLPCLGGGREVTLSRLTGPAVVSLWASWCTSCPHELPLFQRLSRQAEGRLEVLGVDYQDTQPGAALTLLKAADATFPQLADPGGSLADTYRVVGLPGILFVDGKGRVTFMLRRIEDYAELTRLVKDHTGIDVGHR